MRIYILLILFLLPIARIAQAASYTPQGDLIGEVKPYSVRKSESLYDIARRYDLGIGEVTAANPGIDIRKPGKGIELTLPKMHILPKSRTGIVLNTAELRLYYFTKDKVLTFPVGIGREGWHTPSGTTRIVLKRKDPVWKPTASIRKENPSLPAEVPAGPKNPLGAYALNLGWPEYALHGTIQPTSIGKRASHGCVRLYPEDIKTLFEAVLVGTPVAVLSEPYKLGWKQGRLYLQVTPAGAPAGLVYASIREQAGNAVIDWQAVDAAIQSHNGIAIPITQPVR